MVLNQEDLKPTKAHYQANMMFPKDQHPVNSGLGQYHNLVDLMNMEDPNPVNFKMKAKDPNQEDLEMKVKDLNQVDLEMKVKGLNQVN